MPVRCAQPVPFSSRLLCLASRLHRSRARPARRRAPTPGRAHPNRHPPPRPARPARRAPRGTATRTCCGYRSSTRRHSPRAVTCPSSRSTCAPATRRRPVRGLVTDTVFPDGSLLAELSHNAGANGYLMRKNAGVWSYFELDAHGARCSPAGRSRCARAATPKPRPTTFRPAARALNQPRARNLFDPICVLKEAHEMRVHFAESDSK